jgi:trk system potassium uptake protein TrkH
MILALLMVVGGCAGSTAGGAKIGRVILFLKLARHEVAASFRPNLVFHAQHNGLPVDARNRAAVVFFLALYLGIALVSVLVVAMLESGTAITFETAASAVIATLSNIGPGFGAVGPTENFADFRAATKSFLAVLMILGRLELFALLALFMPSLWKRYS